MQYPRGGKKVVEARGPDIVYMCTTIYVLLHHDIGMGLVYHTEWVWSIILYSSSMWRERSEQESVVFWLLLQPSPAHTLSPALAERNATGF